MMQSDELLKLISFRQKLHQHPELSGNEEKTSEKIYSFIKKLNPDKVYENIGGYGLAFVFDDQIPGKTIIFRADMDALAIQEESDVPYKSVNSGFSHVCGHDGHMAILSGLAQKLSLNRPLKGKIILLFQPAEETGEGAKKILKDHLFLQVYKPDYIFALHNLPGFPLNSVVVKINEFASASEGFVLNLIGKASHAAEPENGISPAIAISKLISVFSSLQEEFILLDVFVSVTVVYIKMGEKAFGTNPGEAEMALTFRSFTDTDLENFKTRSLQLIRQICKT